MADKILIIGSGPGIGAAMALRFAEQGYGIVLASRSFENGKAIADEIHKRSSGSEVQVDSVDVSDSSDIVRLIAAHAENLKVVHYNAASMRYDAQGNLKPAELAELDNKTIERDITVNITGALVAVRESQKLFQQNGGGTILLTGGGFAKHPASGFSTLSAGKATIRNIAEGQFEAFKEQNIHIATVMVCASVAPWSEEAREIAGQFWELTNETRDSWRFESVYAPS